MFHDTLEAQEQKWLESITVAAVTRQEDEVSGFAMQNTLRIGEALREPSPDSAEYPKRIAKHLQ